MALRDDPDASNEARRVLIPVDIAPPSLPEPGAQVLRFGGATMGTDWTVKLCARPPAAVQDIDRAIKAVLDGVIAEMSPWQAGSRISQFNTAAAGSWHDLPQGFATVLDCALDVARLSEGAYDPTIGVLVDLWGFGPAGRRHAPPSENEIAVALTTAGWRRLQRDDAGRALQPGGMQLDFSSIAKGYAVDGVAEALQRAGITSFLVEIGGELRGCGVKPDGLPWWVALEQPASERFMPEPAETIIALHARAVATSGDSQRYFEHGGRRMSHTIDPRDGRPVQNDIAALTVIHPSCMKADVWATALTVLGPEDGFDLACAQDLAARFLIRGDDRWHERVTPGFIAMMQ